MKKVIVTTLILVLKILGAVIAAIKDFILYMVAILFTILISKGLFVSIAAISQNGFGDFFGNLFAEGFFGFVLLFIGGPAVLVIFAELIVFLIGAVGYVAHILNIISQYVLGKIVVFIDSICMKLYNLLPENDSIRNNQYFVYLVETSSDSCPIAIKSITDKIDVPIDDTSLSTNEKSVPIKPGTFFLYLYAS